MPSDRLFKTMNAVHRVALKLTGNRVGARLSGMQALELTTIGRKSGKPRSVMLTAPVQEGDAYVLVASRGGDDNHPAWFLNLRDNPAVEVQVVGRPKQQMRARIATPEERVRLWPIAVKQFKSYGDYQKRTNREIPLVIVEP
ncbi:MAG TPA: nitroreductase/quinone reductase family protein [Jatrophihabitans sp.]|jgi:deazaflavin-dependent oxidoreductase (nitroreductase family)|uniref:nitroreductase/quinone reductase family protein n=1 Tax=Jatrophihabitans sp. TaxID=1932789 RepID=UPI002EEEBD61